MTNADRKRFQTCIRGLAGATRGFLDDEAMAGYFKALDDFDIADVERAAEWFLDNGQKMPTSNEWRQRIGQQTAGKQSHRCPLCESNEGFVWVNVNGTDYLQRCRGAA